MGYHQGRHLSGIHIPQLVALEFEWSMLLHTDLPYVHLIYRKQKDQPL
jgi:hypothetical protein